MIPEDKVREVAERLSIVDIIGEYLSLRRSGANFVGLCPFHGEKTPSFNVNPAKEIFHCFGCGAGGNIFSFVMRIEGLSFPEAFRKLAARAGIAVEERPLTPAEQKALKDRDEQRSIMLLAAHRYREVLTKYPDGSAARSYLQKREVDPETAAAYGLGCAPTRRDALAQHIQDKGFSLEVAASLGVVRKGDRGWYDLLHSRLIFPIRNAEGQPIAFAGRVLDDGLPKYINSPESPIYRKSSVLFGIDLALRDIRKNRSAIVVEGYFDHLALYRAGIRNALATCGTALTDGHVALIKKHAEQVYLLFDSDNAGRSATVKAMELCLEQSLPAYVISLPQGDDPDSYLQKHGSEAFQARIEGAKPAFEQFLLWLLTKTPPDSIDSRVRLMDEITPRFKKISDPVERNLYEKEICRLLGIDLQAFRRRLANQSATQQHLQNRQEPVKLQLTKSTAPRDACQETILGIMAAYPEAHGEIQSLGLSKIFDRLHISLAEALLKAAETTDSQEFRHSMLFSRLDTEEQKELAARLLVNDKHLADIDWRAALRQCIQQQQQSATKELKQLSIKLSTLTPDSPEFQEMLKKADELRNRKFALQ